MGDYVIQSEDDGWRLYLPNEEDHNSTHLLLEAAKAAAQADYEARIRAALVEDAPSAKQSLSAGTVDRMRAAGHPSAFLVANPPAPDDLVERLRNANAVGQERYGMKIQILDEAADALTALAAENAGLWDNLKHADEAANALAADKAANDARVKELEGALAPFADIADLIDVETEGVADTDKLILMLFDYEAQRFSVTKFRAARAALGSKGG